MTTLSNHSNVTMPDIPAAVAKNMPLGFSAWWEVYLTVGALFFIGVSVYIGHCSILITIWKNPQFIKVPKYKYLMSLSASAIVVASFVVPNEIIPLVSPDINIPAVCKTCEFFFGGACLASYGSQFAFSSERFRNIYNPNAPVRSTGKVNFDIFLIWAIAFIWAIRAPFIFTTLPVTPYSRMCILIPALFYVSKKTVIIDVCVQSILFIIIGLKSLVLLCFLTHKVGQSDAEQPGVIVVAVIAAPTSQDDSHDPSGNQRTVAMAQTDEQRVAEQKKARKDMIMMSVITIVFILTQYPVCGFLLYFQFGTITLPINDLVKIARGVIYLAISTGMWTPILIYTFNDELRKAARKVFCR